MNQSEVGQSAESYGIALGADADVSALLTGLSQTGILDEVTHGARLRDICSR
jgi:hypothetical protein